MSSHPHRVVRHRRYIAALAAVAAVVAVVVVAGLTRPAGSRPVAAVRPAATGSAVRATLFCPDIRRLEGTLSTGVVAATTTPGAGSVTIAPATGVAAAGPLIAPHQSVGTYAGGATGPVVLQATGAPAGGLVAEQVARGNKTTDRGWAEARCEPARSDQWFVGAATQPGDTPTVILANPGATRAIVTITVLTPAGLVAAPAGGNLLLAPHTVQSLPLSGLAPGVAATAVDVRTETGLVSAAVRDVRADGETLLGTDYLPVGEPGTNLTLPGFPGVVTGTPPLRVLYLGNPSSSDATVQITVTTPDGTVVPVGYDAIAVSAQSVRAVDLSKVLGNRPATVTVRSVPQDGHAAPIVAGAVVDAASTLGSGIHEIAYLGPVAPLQGASLIPVVHDQVPVEHDGDPVDSVLIVSAPRGAAVVTVTAHPPSGGAAISVIHPVPAGTTIALSMNALRVPDGSSVTVTPSAGSGAVYAARLIEEAGTLGPLLSAYQVTGTATQQPIPAVAPLPIGQH